jgi:dihydrofolate synthase/folylpolyglutamate synthase
MTYEETLDFLFSSLPMFQRIGAAAYKANLDNTEALDSHFGHPHRNYHTIHVAGTNGKGSTSHMLASILQEQGYRVGLYTSPHLKDFRERIKINGEMIPRESVVDFVEQNRPLIEQLRPSFFEMTVAMAFDYFARNQVDVAVIEVGMGGRLDSTNIITPLASVITNISFDHTQFLGETLPAIAGEKAGIIKPSVPVVIGERDAQTESVFESKAAEQNSPITFASDVYKCTSAVETDNGQRLTFVTAEGELVVDCDLAGDCQRLNVATVLTTVEQLNRGGVLKIDNKSVINGIAHAAEQTGLMGRWQILNRAPLTVCDTGHNVGGMALVGRQITRQKYNRLWVVFGVVEDKDLEAELPFLPREGYYYFTNASVKRAMPADELTRKATAAGLRGESVPEGVAEALRRAKANAQPDDMIYIGGSTFIVADVPEL